MTKNIIVLIKKMYRNKILFNNKMRIHKKMIWMIIMRHKNKIIFKIKAQKILNMKIKVKKTMRNLQMKYMKIKE